MNADLIRSVSFTLTGGFLVFLALTVVRDNLANRLNRVTGAMLFFAGLGPLSLALGIVVSQSAEASLGFRDSTLFNLQYVWEFFFPFLVLFSMIFPEDRFKDFQRTRLPYLLFMPAVLHLLLMLFYGQLAGLLGSLKIDPDAGGFSRIILVPMQHLFSLILLVISFIRTYHTTIFGWLSVAYVLIAIYCMESGRRLVTNPRLLTQTRIVFRGMWSGLGIFVLSFAGNLILPDLFTEGVTSAMLVFASAIGVGMIVYATVRYQFLDVRLRFRQSFVYTITSALLVGIYIVLVMQSKSLLQPIFGAQTEIVSYALIILILLCFQPINSGMDTFIRSVFMRTRTDHQSAIERFSRQVISLFDPLKLRQIIEETLKTSLLVERVYFVLYDDEIEEYAILRSDDFSRRVAIDRDDLLLRGINMLESPTYLHSLADYMEDSKLAGMLKEHDVRLILPMKDAEHMLGFLALSGKVAGYKYSGDDFNLLGVLSNQMVTALTNARLYVESLERARLQEEVSMARQIQLDLLPSHPPALDTVAISVHSTPSRTVGGDFYDFIPIDDRRLGIVIADASGKGMPAALMIAQIQAIIHSEVNNGSRIATMFGNMNEQLAAATSPEKYVTIFYGELDIVRGELAYCNGGHNYPILARADGQIELLKVGGPLVGALPQMEYTSSSIRMESDDVLFMFTDGLSEAMDEDEQEYGENRIREWVSSRRDDCAQGIMDYILEDVRNFDPIFPPRDDTTVISMKLNNKVRFDG
ncbi:MAG: PP2C family protein-serine/threonine phosphatase [candidate division Zixibacteria bacterium]|nr:PP2C family protein-serine/threonine phosphatase [candidate division Zixibacteria bacterium]